MKMVRRTAKNFILVLHCCPAAMSVELLLVLDMSACHLGISCDHCHNLLCQPLPCAYYDILCPPNGLPKSIPQCSQLTRQFQILYFSVSMSTGVMKPKRAVQYVKTCHISHTKRPSQRKYTSFGSADCPAKFIHSAAMLIDDRSAYLWSSIMHDLQKSTNHDHME